MLAGSAASLGGALRHQRRGGSDRLFIMPARLPSPALAAPLLAAPPPLP